MEAVAAGQYETQRQLPEPSEMTMAVSLAAVVIFAAPGRIRLVALWVRVKAPANLRIFHTPAATVPNPVIVVVPVMLCFKPPTAPRSVVVAEAISAPKEARSNLITA